MPALRVVTVAAEQRRSPRKRVLKAATIIFKDGNCAGSCQVLDISETGARLGAVDALLCPRVFTLKFRDGSVHDCEVRWRGGDTLGVSFL
jgi:hypothetical protein